MSLSCTADILAHALDLGFDRAGIIPIGPPRRFAAFADWLAAGYAGDMAYLAARAAERADPARLAPDARSMIVLVADYNPLSRSQVSFQKPGFFGRIARYAWSQDYHDLLKRRLYELDAFIRARTGRQAPGKACVDTAPLLERDFAEQAGLGFIGRNTCLITPGLGSWTFLAALLVPEDLSPGPSPGRGGERLSPLPSQGRACPELVEGGAGGVRCGRCTRCLDACPTQAFVAPYVLDARRCISYLTIELRGPIPRELRPLMGDWVFGCDVCQEVCPYNRRRYADDLSSRIVGDQSAQHDRERDFGSLRLSELLALDEAGFRGRFHGTPVMRARRRGLVRNACVAAGNAGDPALAPALSALLADPEPLVRGHAAWALGRIGGAEVAAALQKAIENETDAWVKAELELAAASCVTISDT